MTLHTRLAVTDPVDTLELWQAALGLVCARSKPQPDPDAVATAVSPAWGTRADKVSTTPGQGLCAWTLLTAPRNGCPEVPDDIHDGRYVAADHGPPCFAVVSFDTGYAYDGPESSATGLHRALTSELGEWLSERGIGWWAFDEYRQVWMEETPQPGGTTETALPHAHATNPRTPCT